MQSSTSPSSPSARPKLKTQFQTVCRRKGYALATERTYWRWVVRFVRYHGTRHPLQMGAAEIRRFLSYLAVDREVASATQNQALNALIFLYESVLGEEVGAIGSFERAKAPGRLPTVLTKGEVCAVLDVMSGTRKLVASLLYGSGLRLSEALRLRVKDLHFDRHQLLVRRGKGKKDRLTMLPRVLDAPLERQLGNGVHARGRAQRGGAQSARNPASMSRHPNSSSISASADSRSAGGAAPSSRSAW